jgi:hypothetical protein
LIMGTLASGSSALVDMLKEYENVNVLPLEFDNFRRPGFVSDQLSYISSIDYPNVIDKELSFENYKWEIVYKSSIWKIFSYKSLRKIWERDWKFKKLNDYKDSLIRLHHIYFLQELNNGLKSQISFQEKIELANKWIQQVGNIYPSKFDYILYNQPLHPWSDPNVWTKVFYPFKLICVLREPKDQIAEMIKRDIIFSPFRSAQLSYGQFNITSIYGNDRRGRMQFLIDALKKRLEKIDQWQKVLQQDQILFIDFEGLINKYPLYKTIIENYLGLESARHISSKMYFDPDVAKKNSLGIFEKYLNAEELSNLSDLEEWYQNKISDISHIQMIKNWKYNFKH